MNDAELQLNFLIKATSTLSQIENNGTQQILRSHYLSRCASLTGHSRLPQKHFSYETRCPRCLLEWNKEIEIRVKTIRLSKTQKRRIRSNIKLKKKIVDKEYLLHSNNMEKECTFCHYITKTQIIKPNESYKRFVQEKTCSESPKEFQKQIKKEINLKTNAKYQLNVYCESKEAFSLSKENTLTNHIIKEPKIIKNNKKKKDKFAGLCHAAVMAAAKIKEEKKKQNKLNLFLKPSSL